MRTVILTAAVALALAVPACVFDAEHVETRLVEVCAADVPASFGRRSADLTVATVAIAEIGATLDDPDARAWLRAITVEAADLAFADRLRVELAAPGSGLADLEIAEAAVTAEGGTLTAAGDPAVDLVDHLTSGGLELRVELAGEAPAADLPATLSACLGVDGLEISDDEIAARAPARARSPR
jgi:hypothetical protein